MEAAAPAHTAARARPFTFVLASSLAVAGLSLLLPSTPSYDPWAWLIWGRELAAGGLDTSAGPAWKPLPVLVTTLLAPLDAAPELWLLLARAAGVAAVLLVGLLAWRLSRGSLVAALVASGSLVLGLLAALLRPEVWSFLLAYGVVLWRRGEERPLLVAVAAVVPLAWFGPELWGSGELLRSTERARVATTGQPALAAVPAFEVLKRFLLMTPLLASVGLGALAWAALVALMSQAGFSGEERYLLPAAAAAAVAAGVAWAERLRPPWVVVFAVLALAPLPLVAREAVEL